MRIIHGTPYARTNYVIWAMKELGLDFEIKPVNPMTGETKSPEYLALNPNGLIPTLEEDGFLLWETTAINSYLAKKYGDGLLWSSDPQEEAQIMQWCVFGAIYVDHQAVNHILHKQALPEDMRDEKILALAKEELRPHLEVLNGHLSDKDYLVAGRFTIADLNLAAMLDYAVKSGYDFSGLGHVQRWLTDCLGRPVRVEMNKR
ncbi:MAG: glutathione S-transferase family protein [Emcibacter sp.]|nr:glutathione S-transferase family protein [Emcibacter sp.]